MSEQDKTQTGERPLPAAWAADFVRVASAPDEEDKMEPNEEPSTTPNRLPATRGWYWLWDGLALYPRTIRLWIAPLAALVTLYILVFWATLTGQLGIGSSWILLTAGAAAAAQLIATALTGMLMLGIPRVESGHRVTLGHLLVSVRKSLLRLILIGSPLALIGAIQYLVSTTLILNTLVGVIDALAFIPGFAEMAASLYVALPDIEDFVTSYPAELLVWTLTLLSLPFWMATFYAPALVVFGDASATQAMRRSFVGCLHNFLPLTLLTAIWYAATLAGAYVSAHSSVFFVWANLFIQLIIFLPTFICVSFVSYREVFVNQNR